MNAQVTPQPKPVAFGAGAAHIGAAALDTIRQNFVVETGDALFELCFGMVARASEAYDAKAPARPVKDHAATLSDTIRFYNRVASRCVEVSSRLSTIRQKIDGPARSAAFHLADHAEFMAITEAMLAGDARLTG